MLWAAENARSDVCNLYNLRTNQHAIRDLVSGTRDRSGNLEPSLHIYPDRTAPAVRNKEGGREFAMLTWAMPTPVEHLKTPDAPATGTTNVRKTLTPQRWELLSKP